MLLFLVLSKLFFPYKFEVVKVKLVVRPLVVEYCGMKIACINMW